MLMDGIVSRKRVFNKEKLEELSKLLEEGVPKLRIAKHFGVDHSSIFYQAKKLAKDKDWLEKRRSRAREFKEKDKYITLKNRKGHCKRCEILLEYAREGRNEDYCGECLNELGIL